MLFAFIVVNNIFFFPSNSITYDVFGYYLYLPLSFIADGSIAENYEYLKAINATYSNSDTLYQIQSLPNGNFVLKYTCGWSIWYAPFFFIAHLLAGITNYPADGFSAPYQTMIAFGSIFYSLIGVYFLYKIARHYFSSKLSLILIALIVLGTNYLFHNTMHGQNAMTHNILFTGYAAVIWLTIRWYKNQNVRTIILLGVVCGLIILTRPTDITCLLIPLFWPTENEDSKIQLFKRKWKQLLLFTAIILVIGSVQLVYWKVVTGQFLFLDYGNPAEGFDFLAPHWKEVLFSFRKGWYIYTPLMLLSTIGFIPLYRSNKRIFLPLFTFFLINLYITSSWSCWWYAQSFSQRALIPSMVIMVFPMGYLFKALVNKIYLRYLVVLVSILFVLLNIFQTIQFTLGVIPGDRMTREYYFASFGMLNPNEKLKSELLMINRKESEKVNFYDTKYYHAKTVYQNDFESADKKYSTQSYSGQYSFQLDENTIYTSAIKMPFDSLTKKDHAFIVIQAKIFKTQASSDKPTLLTASFDYKGATYKWRSKSIAELPENEWSTIEMVYLTPEPRTKQDQLNVHFWHRNNTVVLVDDIEIKVYEPRNNYR